MGRCFWSQRVSTVLLAVVFLAGVAACDRALPSETPLGNAELARPAPTMDVVGVVRDDMDPIRHLRVATERLRQLEALPPTPSVLQDQAKARHEIEFLTGWAERLGNTEVAPMWFDPFRWVGRPFSYLYLTRTADALLDLGGQVNRNARWSINIDTVEKGELEWRYWAGNVSTLHGTLSFFYPYHYSAKCRRDSVWEAKVHWNVTDLTEDGWLYEETGGIAHCFLPQYA